MSLDPQFETLLESFMQLCDSVVENAFVVTDGMEIAGIVLQESLAKHICRKIVNTYKIEDRKRAEKEWVVCSFPSAMKYAFERGQRVGIDVALKKICEEAPNGKLAQTKENDNDREDSQLRDGQL